jgi:hypothetical protein
LSQKQLQISQNNNGINTIGLGSNGMAESPYALEPMVNYFSNDESRN